MSELFVMEWPTHVQKKLDAGIESEDCPDWSEDDGYCVVADGVTRSLYDRPGTSLAFLAASYAMKAASHHLFQDGDPDDTIRKAFQAANDAVRRLNMRFSLWSPDKHDYLTKDLAGTCLACTLRREDRCWYGCVGDCRVAHLSSPTKFWITPDQVAQARTEFPTEGTQDERTVIIRKERRNNPTSPHKTYGVLTGEDAALDPLYFTVGSFSYAAGDVVAVFSDGLASFVENDERFRRLLFVACREELYTYINSSDSPWQTADEKTLIMYRG